MNKLSKKLSFIIAFSLFAVFICGNFQSSILKAFAESSAFQGASGVADNISWEISSDGVLTVSGSGDMPDVLLSDGSENETETSTEDSTEETTEEEDNNAWFDYTEYITSIVVEKGITSIGEYEFAFLTSNEKVTIPSTVTKIGKGAFFMNTALNKVTLPSSLEEIGVSAFAMTGLLSCKIPKSVKWIHSYAFAYCNSLTEFTILDNGVYIGEYAVGYISNSSGNKIYSSDLTINGYANSSAEKYADKHSISFENLGNASCENYIPECYAKKSSGTVSDTVSWTLSDDNVLEISGSGEIPSYSLSENDSPDWYGETLSSAVKIVIDDGITSIGDYAFSNCENVTEISLPTSLVEIGEHAFDYNSCTAINIPEGVNYIGSKAFYSYYVTDITLPDTLEYMSVNSFGYSSKTVITGSSCTLAEIFCSQYGVTFNNTDGENSISTKDVLADGYNFESLGFTNSSSNFSNSIEEGQYYLSDNELKTLFDNITNLEYYYYDMWDLIKSKWSGSCYGMVALLTLVHNGTVAIEQLGYDLSSVSDLKPDKNIESIINYYMVTQITENKYQSVYESYSSTDLDKITKLLSQVETAQSNNEYLAISLYGDTWGHELVATGIRDGSWKFNGEIFDKCIMTLDPNYSSFNLMSCIYVDSTTGDWTVPLYYTEKQSKTIYGEETVSVNEKGLFDSSVVDESSYHYDEITYMDANDSTIVRALSQSNSSLKGTLLSDIAGYIDQEIITKSGKKYYQTDVFNKNDSDLNYYYKFQKSSDSSDSQFMAQTLFDKSAFGAIGYSYASYIYLYDNKAYVKFNGKHIPTGEGSYTIESNQYFLSSVVDDGVYESSYPMLTVSGQTTYSASLTITDEGYVIQTDDIENTKISAYVITGYNSDSKETDKEIDFDLYSSDIPEDVSSVLVKRGADDELEIYYDSDDDGTYDKLVNYVEKYVDAKIITGDDGKTYALFDDDNDGETDRVMRVDDVTEITADTKIKLVNENDSDCVYADTDGDGVYETYIGTLEKEQSDVLSGDANGDGKVNAVDAVLVLQYYAESLTGKTNSIDIETVNADMNSDGNINSVDAVMILQVYAKGILGK